MNRRDNGVTVMNTPRRAFGELKNLAYGGTPRSIDNIKARSNVINKNIDCASVKKTLVTPTLEIPPAPQFQRLKKADSLEELCAIASAKRSFAVYNDSDSEVETFGEKDSSLKDFCLNQEESIILTEDDDMDLLENTLSTIEEISLMDDDQDDDEDTEDLEIEVPFAGGADSDSDEYSHIPEELVLTDGFEPQFYTTSYVPSDSETDCRSESEYESESEEDCDLNDDELRLQEAALAEMMTHIHFTDFVC
ncbi:unnamed protein product [Auanema sp. JU1783]|nr:unnamed protein product [Auanema sp. JU1783]